MAVRNELLGGTDWEDAETLYAADLNDTFDKVTGELSSAVKLIGLNALYILDLTAQNSLTAGINANFERDIYTDSDGYLDTIDTGNTTAIFLTDKYQNTLISDDWSKELVYHSSNPNTKLGFRIYNGAKTITNLVVNWKVHGANAVLKSADGSTTHQTVAVDGSGNSTFTFDLQPNTEYLIESATGSTYYFNKLGDITTRLSSTDGNFEIGSHGTDGWIHNVISVNATLLVVPADLVVQTNPQTIESGFTKFMIVANEETTGTGSVTYDITFNSDADTPTYQEDLESFKEYSIEEAGTSLILKQKLNIGASGGGASAYNWGVLLW
jgi:hypothetical protein